MINCYICKIRFGNRESLTNHIFSMHRNELKRIGRSSLQNFDEKNEIFLPKISQIDETLKLIPNKYDRKITELSCLELKEKIISNYSMVPMDAIEVTEDIATEVYCGKYLPQGDIVECGVWKGGMSIILAKLFPDRKVYMCDSYEGFEPIGVSPYSLPLADNPDGEAYGKERHFPGKVWIVNNKPESSVVSLEQVKENLKTFNLSEENGIVFVKGFVSKTLAKDVCPIGQIAVLRIDVDSFAATYEVLILLYDKVVQGGIVIFDDFLVDEARTAIHRFERERGLNFVFKPGHMVGCYITKE